MKRAFYLSLAILVASCSGSAYDPWNFDPSGNQNGGEEINTGGGGDDDDDSGSSAASDPAPSESGITVDAESDSEDNIANSSFDGTITVVYNGNDATVTGSVSGVTVTKNGARVTATNTGDNKVKYVLSGTSTDGFFKLYSSKKQAIVLSNLSLANTKGAAINNQSKKRTFVVIEGTNTLSDGSLVSDAYPEETESEDMKAAFFSEAQLAFSGTGKLTVNAKGKAGITSDDYIRFLTGSNVSVTSSAGHGIRGKDAIIVTGGTVNVTLESGATGKKCFTTDSLMYFGGGVTTLVNKASAGMVDSELTGAAGIKSDQIFVMRDGELSITASGKGCKCISCDANGFFEGGKVTAKATGSNYGSSYSSSDDTSSSKAIKFDGHLIFSGTEVYASASSHEGIEAKGCVTVSGGKIQVVSSDDAMNSGSTFTVSDGILYAYSTGNDGLDANGDMYIKGGTVYAIGTRDPEVGLDANTEKGYKLYVQGGNVIAIGGLERSSSVSQPVISCSSWSKNSTYSLCKSDGSVIFSFKTPSAGGTALSLSSSSLTSGTSYSLKTSATVSGAESYFDGIIGLGGTASGGSSTNVTATSYSSSGGSQGGGSQGGGHGWWH